MPEPSPIALRDEWFHEENGFEHPDWDAIAEWIDRRYAAPEQHEAWASAARQWLSRLEQRLGEPFHLAASSNFLLLSPLSQSARQKVLQFTEQASARVLALLGELRGALIGKGAGIIFRTDAEYYAYISRFYPEEGQFAASGGICIHSGYTHFVLPSADSAEMRNAIAHELTHDLLSHLPLPTWLNEAITMAVEADLCGSAGLFLDRELEKRHRAFWNSQTIQQFWSGASWHLPGEGNELSYSLAQIVLRVIHNDLRPDAASFRAFLGAASWEDAGEKAAAAHLRCSLGELAEVFLGSGDWSPNPARWRVTNAGGPEARVG